MSKIKDSEIQNLISNKEYEQAQLLIDALEEEFYFEKSKYGQKILKERIANHKKMMLSKNKIEISEEMQTKPKVNLQVLQNKIKNQENLLEIVNGGKNIANAATTITETDKNITVPMCLSQVIFYGCKNVTTNNFECADSVYIKDSQDSHFTFSAKQIRLVNCTGILLEIHTKTGVFIENCSGIQIKRLEENENDENMYKNVKDFTNPFSNANYKILE